MMTTPGQARTLRSSTLRALALSTALAGSMTLLPNVAHAQNNTPSGATVVSPGGGTAPTFNGGGTGNANGTPTNLNVDLRDSSTIINWNRFDIANGSTVNFNTGLAGDVAVLNRVTGGNPSNISGALNSAANVNVFLLNPAGIMISSTGTVSTGSFVATTLDISNSDFAAGNYSFAGANNAAGITVNGRITTRGTGIGLILLGRTVNSNGDLDGGTQDVALVAATDVKLNFTPGSPLAIEITEGTNVSNAMQVVGGTIQGRNVFFGMATRSNVTNALLQVEANVTAVAGAKGIVIVGGRSTIDSAVTAPSGGGNNNSGTVRVSTGGSLIYAGSSAGAGVDIGGTGAVTVASTVDSGGDYKVRGDSVTLGRANSTILQRAQGGVSVRADDGDISGLGTLTLIADRAGAGGTPLVLDADGNIDFGTNTTLNAGGSSLASAIHIFNRNRNANVRLGDVSALKIDGGLSGGALEGKLVRAFNILGNGGDITLGTVTLADAQTIEADDLTVGGLSASGAVSLKAASAMRVGTVNSTGSTVSLVANTLGGVPTGSRANATASGAVTIDVSGSALLGAVTSTSDLVSVEAGTFDISSVSAVTGATLLANNGDARVGGISVSNGAAVIDADDNIFATGPVSISGNYSVTGDNVTLSGTQAAGGAATITARGTGTITNSGTLNLTANSDGAGTEVLTLRGRMNLTSTSTLNGGSAKQSAVVIDTGANNDIKLGNVTGASLSIAGGATINSNLVLGNVDTTADLGFVSNQSISAGNLTSAGLVSLQAPVLAVGDIQAATSVTLSGRQVDFGAINAATAILGTTGTTSTRRLSGNSVTTSGAVTLTSASGAITIDGITAGGGLGVTSAGAVTLGTVGVTGDATITTTGANDITLTALTATGAVALTSGDDIAAGSIASSGGTVTLVADDVTGIGTGRAALSAAGALSVTAGGNARLAAVSGNTVNVQAATIDAGAVSGPAGITLKATGGTLKLAGLSTTGGDVSLTASDAVTVDGPVSITGNYAVTGKGVTLGGTQDATGTVDVTATGTGTISSLAGLRLTANSDGVGTEALTLHGSANLGTDSLLRGGPGRQSQVIIDSSAAGNFKLGDVDAEGLVIAGGAPLSGSLTFGNVTTTGAVTLVVDGGITGTGITSTGGTVSLTGAGAATVGTLSGSTVDVSMQGNVAIDYFTATAGAANLASTGGSVTLKSGSATGNVNVTGQGAVAVADAITAGADYRVRGASVALGMDGDAEIQSAGGIVDITSASGTITGGTGLTLRSGTGALILDGAGGIDLGAGLLQAGSAGTGQLGLRAGNGQTIDLGDSVKAGTIGSVDAVHSAIGAAFTHNGNLRFGTLDAADAVDIRLTSGNLTGTALNGAGSVAIDAGSGTVDLGALTATALTVNGGTLQGGNWSASGNVALTGGAITLVGLDSTGGATSATTSAGTLSIDTAHAATDLLLTANGGADISVGTASAAGNVSLIATGGDILVDSATAGATLTLKSGGDILGRSGGTTPGLSGTDVVIEVTGNLTTGGITSPGGLSITSGSMNIGSVSAGTALSLTASQGAMVLGSASAGGAISLTATGAIDVGTLTSGAGVTLDAGGALAVHQLTAPGAVTAHAGGLLTLDQVQAASLTSDAASATLGTLTLDALTLKGGGANIADATVTGAVTSDLSGALRVDTLKAGSAVLKADSATLGTLTLGTLTLTGGSASIATGTVTGATTADLSGTLAIDMLTGADVTVKAGTLTANSLTASGVTALTGGSGGVDLGQLNGTGAITIGSAGTVAVDGWQAPAGMTITAANDVTLGTGTASALTVTGRGISVTNATVNGAATLTASGALNVQALRGGNLAFKAASITADGLTATGTTMLTSTTGTIDLGQLNGAGAITLASADGVVVDNWQAPAGMTITAANAVNLGTGTASMLTVTAGSIQLADGTITGDANLTATGALGISKLRAANAVLKGGTATLGTLNLGALTLTGGAATITDATVTGTASIDLTGALGVDRLTAATATLLAGGTATLGNVTGTTALTVRAGDLVLNGTLKAPTVTVGSRDAAGGLRLGAAADEAGAGLGLSAAEIARIEADRAVFDGGSGEVTVGTLAFGAQTGRTHVDILTTGDLKVVGVVEGEGAGRLFRFGGSTSDTTLARTIQILATAEAGGRLFFGNADLELRGAKIALGQSGLLDGLFANGGASVDQAAALIGSSNSPLYSALAGGSPYVTGQETTLSAGRLTVRFDDFALFQNTGTRGFNTGVVIGGNPSGGPALSLIGPGGGKRTAFAMFGTINGVSGTSTAVLGNTVISSTGIDLANARVNGCVLGTAAGCLTTTISQPTLNVFDPGRLVVFRAEADFTLPFDPVLGSNNEALFAGVGSIAEPGAPEEDRDQNQPPAAQQPNPQEQK